MYVRGLNEVPVGQPPVPTGTGTRGSLPVTVYPIYLPCSYSGENLGLLGRLPCRLKPTRHKPGTEEPTSDAHVERVYARYLSRFFFPEMMTSMVFLLSLIHI